MPQGKGENPNLTPNRADQAGSASHFVKNVSSWAMNAHWPKFSASSRAVALSKVRMRICRCTNRMLKLAPSGRQTECPARRSSHPFTGLPTGPTTTVRDP